MRGSLWWQLTTAIVVVLAAIAIRSSTGQTPAPEPRKTLNIDFVAVLHAEGQPSDDPEIDDHPEVYNKTMSDAFKKWYPIAEDKTRVAIVGNKKVGEKYEWGSILEWTTDVAAWDSHIEAAYPEVRLFDVSLANALKYVQERVLSSDSGRPKVVLFLTFATSYEPGDYKVDAAKERLNSLKDAGVLLLIALNLNFDDRDSTEDRRIKAEAEFEEFFRSGSVYEMSLPITWQEKMKGLPAWIESRVTSYFCNESYQTEACFFNAQHQCKRGIYHSKVPLIAGDCEALNYQLPPMTEPCANATSCDATCDQMWPWDGPCSASTCGDKAPKRQGPPKWNQLKNCPATKSCQGCSGGNTEAPVVEQLIVAVVISAWSMISG